MTQTRKVVINNRIGGFSLSEKAVERYAEQRGIAPVDVSPYDIARDDSTLVAIVEQLEHEANGRFARLKVVEIPGDVEWTVQEYDGAEWIAEKHRTWG
jgi:hypothetical protein